MSRFTFNYLGNLKPVIPLNSRQFVFHVLFCNCLSLPQIVGTKCDMLHRETLFNLDSLHFRLRALYPDIPVRFTDFVAEYHLVLESRYYMCYFFVLVPNLLTIPIVKIVVSASILASWHFFPFWPRAKPSSL